MSYRFTAEADSSLSEFGEEVTRDILELIEDAAEKDFYGYESYSFVYDHHGRAWDKLDAKKDGLNHRIFFRKIDGKFYILEVFDRDSIDYEENGLYNQLKRISNDEK